MLGLAAFVGRQAGAIELRPDHKLVYLRQCDDPPARLPRLSVCYGAFRVILPEDEIRLLLRWYFRYHASNYWWELAMAKAFSVLSWNVEHFGARDKEHRKFKKDPGPIVKLIAEQKPDVVAIYEVRSDIVFRPLIEEMPEHHFFITEGPQLQEILVGVRKSVPAFATQKTTFKSGQSTLRPGMLLTPYIDGAYYPLLFLHVKSMTDPKGFGLRYDMTIRAFDFRKTLKKAAGGQTANYIFLGDLNTMGMNYYKSDKDISGDREILELARAAKRRGMRLLDKSHDNTYWSPTYGDSDLDQVVAAEHLEFKQFQGNSVRVSGWPDEPTEQKKAEWVATYSDHALLYFVVQKV